MLKNSESPEASVLREIQAAASGLLAHAIQRWLSDSPCDVTVWYRSRAMIMISEGDLPPFERDQEYRSYRGNNHVFADLLGPLSADYKDSIVFWMSPSNSAGCRVERVGRFGAVLVLGKPYSFAQVAAALNSILQEKGVRRQGDWFAGVIRENRLDPDDPTFANLFTRDPDAAGS